MNGTYLAVAGLCLICLTVRTAYELLKKSGRVDLENKALFAAVFAAMCLMLASWPAMGLIDPLRIVVPTGLRWIGLGTAAAGLALAVVGLAQLRGLEDIDHLVTTGLYSRLRHPMYYGFILWIAGSVLAFGAIASLGIGTVGIANILYWRRLEEGALRSRYGEEYRAYQQGTWF